MFKLANFKMPGRAWQESATSNLLSANSISPRCDWNPASSLGRPLSPI